MVDAQSIEHPVAQQLEGEAVSVVKQLRQFHAQASELIDVEKAPVVDVIGGNPEMRCPPMLALDQPVELAPGLQSSRLAVDAVNRSVYRLPHIIALSRQRTEFGLQIFGVLCNARAPVWEAGESIPQALELRMLVAKHASVVQRVDRQF